jgi:hypothetical protein
MAGSLRLDRAKNKYRSANNGVIRCPINENIFMVHSSGRTGKHRSRDPILSTNGIENARDLRLAHTISAHSAFSASGCQDKRPQAGRHAPLFLTSTKLYFEHQSPDPAPTYAYTGLDLLMCLLLRVSTGTGELRLVVHKYSCRLETVKVQFYVLVVLSEMAWVWCAMCRSIASRELVRLIRLTKGLGNLNNETLTRPSARNNSTLYLEGYADGQQHHYAVWAARSL